MDPPKLQQSIFNVLSHLIATMPSTVDVTTLIARMTDYMTITMRAHDPSHNPAHVHRVVNLAHSILAREQARTNDVPPYNTTVITLAALLHDINDRKYNRPQALCTTESEASPVRTALLANGADQDLAGRVDTIVSHVSYSSETKSEEGAGEVVRRLIHEDGYPELAIVQDADRLDALGAVGVGRCFAYLGARAVKRNMGTSSSSSHGGAGAGDEAEGEVMVTPLLDDAIEHFGEKLEKLEGMMKTETGRAMARLRSERLRVFREWWEEEMAECMPDKLEDPVVE